MCTAPLYRVSAKGPAKTRVVGGERAWLDAGRVALLRVVRGSGASWGSSYRVTDTAVLTAAHVLANAQQRPGDLQSRPA
jgi:hypothetical protein